MSNKEPRNRGARFLLISASLVVVIAGLREIRPIALPLLIAFFLTVLSSPIFAWLLKKRVPRALAMLTTVLANLGVLLALGLVVGGSVRDLSAALPDYQNRAEARARSVLVWLESKGVDTSELDWLQKRVALEPRPPLRLGELEPEEPVFDPDVTGQELESKAYIQLDVFVGVFASTLRGIASVSAMVLLVLLTMVFTLLESARFPQKLEVAFGWKPSAMVRMNKAKLEIQRYLGYKTLISLGTGLAAGLWVWFLDVRFPILWGLIAFMLNYIPSLGSIFAAIPPVILAWIDESTATAALVGLGYLVINITLGNFLEPQLMGRRLGISALVVFLSLIFWGWLWGPVGMLLSVPLTMILRIGLENTEDFRWLAQLIAANPRPLPAPGDEPGAVAEGLRGSEDPAPSSG